MASAALTPALSCSSSACGGAAASSWRGASGPPAASAACCSSCARLKAPIPTELQPLPLSLQELRRSSGCCRCSRQRWQATTCRWPVLLTGRDCTRFLLNSPAPPLLLLQLTGKAVRAAADRVSGPATACISSITGLKSGRQRELACNCSRGIVLVGREVQGKPLCQGQFTVPIACSFHLFHNPCVIGRAPHRWWPHTHGWLHKRRCRKAWYFGGLPTFPWWKHTQVSTALAQDGSLSVPGAARAQRRECW
jgi:hypothetical protein